MKRTILALMAGIVGANEYSADNSVPLKIISIESRDSGSHALYFSGSMPTQNCTYNDRAIIDGSSSTGAKMLLSVALTALTAQKDVIVRVDDCIPLDPPYPDTSPHAIKLQIYN